MSTVSLAVQTITRAGIAPTYTADGASPLLNVADTFQFNNTGREILHFKKAGATNCNVTIVTPGTVDGLAIAERTKVVPATTGDVMMGPFPPDIYNTPGTATFAGFTVDNITGLTVAILRI
jgi:hypothetical protein